MLRHKCVAAEPNAVAIDTKRMQFTATLPQQDCGMQHIHLQLRGIHLSATHRAGKRPPNRVGRKRRRPCCNIVQEQIFYKFIIYACICCLSQIFTCIFCRAHIGDYLKMRKTASNTAISGKAVRNAAPVAATATARQQIKILSLQQATAAAATVAAIRRGALMAGRHCN